MAEETDLQHVLQNADQLFDENQYQEAIDLLKKYPVSKKSRISSSISHLTSIYNIRLKDLNKKKCTLIIHAVNFSTLQLFPIKMSSN